MGLQNEGGKPELGRVPGRFQRVDGVTGAHHRLGTEVAVQIDRPLKGDLPHGGSSRTLPTLASGWRSNGPNCPGDRR